jgi:hypothetical protein
MVLAKTDMQTNGIEDTQISTYKYSHLMFHKSAKTHEGKKTVSSTNGVGKTGYLHAED